MLWNPEGQLIYVGYTGRQSERLAEHLNGSASILYDKVGRILHEELDREATEMTSGTGLGGARWRGSQMQIQNVLRLGS